MEGGIRAWEGLIAEGPPEAGMAYFPETAGPEELIGLAWVLEEGSRKFYSALAGLLRDEEGAAVFRDLTAAEEQHKTSLMGLLKSFPKSEAGEDFPGTLATPDETGDVMEGGMRVGRALQWAQGKPLGMILELAMSLETNAYDLYIKMKRKIDDVRSGEVFALLAREEKLHLGKLAALLELKM
jgi:sulfur-carrier protein adenylyltransferase/sulfurtransferase